MNAAIIHVSDVGSQGMDKEFTSQRCPLARPNSTATAWNRLALCLFLVFAGAFAYASYAQDRLTVD